MKVVSRDAEVNIWCQYGKYGLIHRHLTKTKVKKSLSNAWWGGKNKEQTRIELDHTYDKDQRA